MAAKETLVEEIHAPNGGLVDTVQLDLLRGSEASYMVNMHHDRLALERREGKATIGNPTPHIVCHGGYHYRRAADDVWQIVRGQASGQGDEIFLYKGTGGNWSAAVNGGVAAGPQDQIGNGRAHGLGTFVQYADRLYWYDGGTMHRLWDGANIRDYGFFGGDELPAGTAVAGSGTSGTAVYSFTFDGATYLTVGITGIHGAGDFTFTAWANFTSTAADGLAWAYGDSDEYRGISINGGGNNRSLSEMQQGATYVRSHSATAVNNATWRLFGMRRSGNQLTHFVDGGPTQTRNCPTTALNATAFYIGAVRRSGAVTSQFTGNIDDVRAYARALSDAEHVALFYGQPIDSTGLKGHWALDEGSGGVIVDSSGTGNNGTITGVGAWSTDVPNALVGGGGGGNLQAGTYKFVYTYYNPSIPEETNPSAESNAVTFATPGGALQATVPANADWIGRGFTTIRFYRTTADGETYFFDHQVENVAALPITETLSQDDEFLGTEVRYDRGEVPRLRYCILFNEMVVGAGNPASPSTLYWSEVGDPTHWPPGNAQDIDRDNGDPITGVFRLLGRLYVLKETSGVYMLTPQFATDGSVSFSVDAVTNDFGCLSHHAVVVIDTYAYWPDAKGICKFNGQQVENISDPKIRNRWKFLASQLGIEAFTGIALTETRAAGYKAPAKQCVAVHDRQCDHQYYRLTIDDFSETPVARAHDLIYDASIGCWFENLGPPQSIGFGTRTSWLVKDRTGQYAVFQADDVGRCFRLRTGMNGVQVWDDGGQPISSRWKSRHWGGMHGVLPKFVDIEYERSAIGETSGPVTINLYADGQTTPRVVDTTALVLYDVNSPAPGAPDSSLPDPTRLTHCVRVPFDAEWCRRFAFEIVVNQTDSDLRILWYRIVWTDLGQMLKSGVG